MKIKALVGALALAASSASFALVVTSVPTAIGDQSEKSKDFFAFDKTFNLNLGSSGSNLTLLFDDFNYTGPLYLGGVLMSLFSKTWDPVATATFSSAGLNTLSGSFSGLTAGNGIDYHLVVLGVHLPTDSKTKATWNATVAVVPEPGTYALLLAGLGVVGFVAKRRRPQS